MGFDYSGIAYLAFLFLIVRTWVRYGRKIPLIFIGLLLLGRYTLPLILGPTLFGFSIYVCLLGIVLALIDRFKSLRWNVM